MAEVPYIRTFPKSNRVVAVGNVATIPSAAGKRHALWIGNNNAGAVQVNFTDNVGTSTGIPIPAGGNEKLLACQFGDGIDSPIQVITTGATDPVDYAEFLIAD